MFVASPTRFSISYFYVFFFLDTKNSDKSDPGLCVCCCCCVCSFFTLYCLVFWFIFVLICVNCISFDFIFPAVCARMLGRGGWLQLGLSDKGMPRAPLGLDGILVALKVVIQLVLLVIVMVVMVAAATVVLLRLVVVLLDRHRNGQWNLLNDRLRVHMCVVLHRHVYSDPVNGRSSRAFQRGKFRGFYCDLYLYEEFKKNYSTLYLRKNSN